MTEVWFDTGTGNLAIGEAASEQLASQIGHMAVPLIDLVTEPGFSFNPGDFERPNTRHLTDAELIEIGSSMARLFLQSEAITPMTSAHVARLNILGLMPHLSTITRRFGTFAEYRNSIGAVGVRESRNFDEFSRSELLNLVFQEYENSSLTGPLTVEKLTLMHNAGLVPSYRYLFDRFGALRDMNEMLGYADRGNWDVEDYIDYGVNVLTLNGPASLTLPNLKILSNLKLGPGASTIRAKFGGLQAYRNLVEKKYTLKQRSTRARAEAVNSHFEDMDYGDLAPTGVQERTITWAKYHVLSDCLPSSRRFKLMQISLEPTDAVVKFIQKKRPGMAQAHIEMIAVSLDLFDELWPTPTNLRQPILPT